MGKQDSAAKKIFRAGFFRHVEPSNKSALGRHLGISYDTVNDWRKDGSALPDIWQAKLLAEFLGKSASEVVFGERAIREREREVLYAIEMATGAKIMPDAVESLPAELRDDSLQRSPHPPLSDKELLEGLGALLTWTRLHKYELPQFGALLPLVVFLTELGASRGLNVPADQLEALEVGISGKDRQSTEHDEEQA